MHLGADDREDRQSATWSRNGRPPYFSDTLGISLREMQTSLGARRRRTMENALLHAEREAYV